MSVDIALVDAPTKECPLLKVVSAGPSLGVCPPIPLDDLPYTSNLLALSNIFGYIAFPLESSRLGLAPIDQVDAALSANSSEWNPPFSIQLPSAPSNISFAMDDRLLVVVCGTSLLTYRVKSIVDGSSTAPIHQIPLQSANVDLVPNPSDQLDFAKYIIILHRDNPPPSKSSTLHIVNIEDASSVASFAQGTTRAAWSAKGKQLVCGMENGSLVQYTPAGQEKAQIPVPPTFEEAHQVIDIRWIENDVFFVAYSPLDPTSMNGTSLYAISRGKTSIEYSKFDNDPSADTFVWGDREERRFAVNMRNWAPFRHLFVCASSLSNTLFPVLAQSETAPLQWSIVELDESSSPFLPSTKAEGDETCPLGLCLDIRSSKQPAFYVLTSDGVIVSWNLVNNSPGATFAGAVNQRDIVTQEIAPSSSITNEKPSAPASALSANAFSALNTSQPTFGTSAFGSTSTSTFGAPSFGTTSFGTTSFGTSKPAQSPTNTTNVPFSSSTGDTSGGAFAQFGGGSGFSAFSSNSNNNNSDATSIFGGDSKPSSGFGSFTSKSPSLSSAFSNFQTKTEDRPSENSNLPEALKSERSTPSPPESPKVPAPPPFTSGFGAFANSSSPTKPPQTQTQTQTLGFGGFGAPKTVEAPTFGASAFGTAAAKPTSLFGSNTSPTATTSNTSSAAPLSQTSSTSSAFGGAKPESSSSTPSFGFSGFSNKGNNNNADSTPAETSAFGAFGFNKNASQTPTAPSGFGAFGTSSSQPTSTLSPSKTQTSGFGSFATSKPSALSFGSSFGDSLKMEEKKKDEEKQPEVENTAKKEEDNKSKPVSTFSFGAGFGDALKNSPPLVTTDTPTTEPLKEAPSAPSESVTNTTITPLSASPGFGTFSNGAKQNGFGAFSAAPGGNTTRPRQTSMSFGFGFGKEATTKEEDKEKDKEREKEKENVEGKTPTSPKPEPEPVSTKHEVKEKSDSDEENKNEVVIDTKSALGFASSPPSNKAEFPTSTTSLFDRISPLKPEQKKSEEEEKGQEEEEDEEYEEEEEDEEEEEKDDDDDNGEVYDDSDEAAERYDDDEEEYEEYEDEEEEEEEYGPDENETVEIYDDDGELIKLPVKDLNKENKKEQKTISKTGDVVNTTSSSLPAPPAKFSFSSSLASAPAFSFSSSTSSPSPSSTPPPKPSSSPAPTFSFTTPKNESPQTSQETTVSTTTPAPKFSFFNMPKTQPRASSPLASGTVYTPQQEQQQKQEQPAAPVSIFGASKKEPSQSTPSALPSFNSNKQQSTFTPPPPAAALAHPSPKFAIATPPVAPQQTTLSTIKQGEAVKPTSSPRLDTPLSSTATPKVEFITSQSKSSASGTGTGIAGEFIRIYQLMEDELEVLRTNTKVCVDFLERYRKPIQTTKDIVTLDDRDWVLGDLDRFSIYTKDCVVKFEECMNTVNAQNQTVKELKSSLYKAEKKREEAARYIRAKRDPEFARWIKVRQLGPEQAENQRRIRHGISTVENTLQHLESRMLQLKQELADDKRGSQLRAPSIDTIRRAIRNISGATVLSMSEIDELKYRVDSLRVQDRANTSRNMPYDMPRSPTSPTKSILRSSPSKPFAQNVQSSTQRKNIVSGSKMALLKSKLVSERKEPLFNQPGKREKLVTHADTDLRQIFAQGPILANKLPLPRRQEQPQQPVNGRRQSLEKTPGISLEPSARSWNPSSVADWYGLGSSMKVKNKTKPPKSMAVHMTSSPESAHENLAASSFDFGPLPPAPPKLATRGFRSFQGLQAPVPVQDEENTDYGDE